MNVSHLEGLFSSEKNPDQWSVCTASQRPPAQTWWRLMSRTETDEDTEEQRRMSVKSFFFTPNESPEATNC